MFEIIRNRMVERQIRRARRAEYLADVEQLAHLIQKTRAPHFIHGTGMGETVNSVTMGRIIRADRFAAAVAEKHHTTTSIIYTDARAMIF